MQNTTDTLNSADSAILVSRPAYISCATSSIRPDTKALTKAGPENAEKSRYESSRWPLSA